MKYFLQLDGVDSSPVTELNQSLIERGSMNFLIFLGSVRESTPPRPARLGMRVSKACEKLLVEKHSEHTVEIIDPLNYDFGDVFKPEFSYHRSKVPAHLAELADKIAKADGYVMVLSLIHI